MRRQVGVLEFSFSGGVCFSGVVLSGSGARDGQLVQMSAVLQIMRVILPTYTTRTMQSKISKRISKMSKMSTSQPKKHNTEHTLPSSKTQN